MKTVIIEDEKAAVRNLTALLNEVDPRIEIIAILDSITETIHWFQENPEPELVFVDIHLADGSAFEIFEHINISCPLIFTTAYDEYALKAFKVNSIDYLLKPISSSDINSAIEKLNLLRNSGNTQHGDIRLLIKELRQKESYKTHFLIPLKGDKLLPLPAECILFFYIHEGNVKAVVSESKEYILPMNLDELTDSLNPTLFFRVNRQYLISRQAVQDIDLWFNSRLSINLTIPTKEKIIISKARVGEFKQWFTGKE